MLRRARVGFLYSLRKRFSRIKVLQIRDLLLELDLKLPKISNVEGFQGQERKVIILSTVRSCNALVDEDIKHGGLGLVASPRRLNVAITRARALLIILGNPELLALDPYWRSVLIYCTDRGAYGAGCNFLPSCITDADKMLCTKYRITNPRLSFQIYLFTANQRYRYFFL